MRMAQVAMGVLVMSVTSWAASARAQEPVVGYYVVLGDGAGLAENHRAELRALLATQLDTDTRIEMAASSLHESEIAGIVARHWRTGVRIDWSVDLRLGTVTFEVRRCDATRERLGQLEVRIVPRSSIASLAAEAARVVGEGLPGMVPMNADGPSRDIPMPIPLATGDPEIRALDGGE